MNAHVNLGAALERQGHWDQAAAQYRQALRLNPACFAAHLNLGQVLRQQGRLDEAIAEYQKALALRPDYADAHVNLGGILAWQGKFEEAAARFRQALKSTPPTPRRGGISMPSSPTSSTPCRRWRPSGP